MKRNTATIIGLVVIVGILIASCGSGGGGGGGVLPVAKEKSRSGKLTASDGAAGVVFGYSASISSDGRTIVAGAQGSNFRTGAAYVYKWNGSSWVQTKLTASDGYEGDEFGSAVSVSATGNTVAVGAYWANVGANVHQGAAYIYKWNGSSWDETKLTASDGAAGDSFGYFLSISSDGKTVAAGAYQTNAVYVYKWNGSQWTETKVTPSDSAAVNNFSVAISPDGAVLVVGALGVDIGANTNQGAAYIFTWDGSFWTETQKLTASDGAAGDLFGISVSASSNGNTVLIGAYGVNSKQGAAYIFTRNGPTWSEIKKLTASDGAANDYFGNSVSISANGTVAAVGSVSSDIAANNDQGAAYVYTWNGSSWVDTRKLSASDGAATQYFGESVSLSSDGNIIVIGADGTDIGLNTDQGAVYVFD